MPARNPPPKGARRPYRLGKLLVLVTVLAMVLAPMAAAAPTASLNYTGDAPAPDPYIDVDTLTVASHPMSEGASDDAMAGVYDDAGEWDSDPPFVVNTTSDVETGDNVNPYSFVVTDIEDDDFGAFPRVGDSEDDDSTDAPASEDNLASALDASEWSKSGANSSKLSVTDTTTAQNVPAVRFDTGTAMASGDIATGSYANWSAELDSDESKRYLQLAVDVNTLDAGTEVQINVTDESGDWKQVTINSSRNYADTDVLANGTGDGYVLQVQLNDLTTNGGGTWENIEDVNVTVRDGDFDGSFAWVDLQKKGLTVIGEEKIDDGDSDDDFDDVQEINESIQGSVSVHSMTTLDTAFDDAVIHDVQFPAKFRAQDLDTQGEEEEWVFHTESASQYPGFDVIHNVSYRLELPALIDLSYSGADLMLDQQWPEERYVQLGVNEGAGTEAFGTITYTDQTGSLGAVSADVGDDINLDSSVSTDTEYAVTFEVKLTNAEADAMTGGAAGGGVGEQEPGGFFSTLLGRITALVGVVVGAIGLRRFMG